MRDAGGETYVAGSLARRAWQTSPRFEGFFTLECPVADSSERLNHRAQAAGTGLACEAITQLQESTRARTTSPLP